MAQSMYTRKRQLPAQSERSFFCGPRQTGKTTLLKSVYPDALRIDLLMSNVARESDMAASK